MTTERYRCWAEIDRSSLRHNAAAVRERKLRKLSDYFGGAHNGILVKKQSKLKLKAAERMIRDKLEVPPSPAFAGLRRGRQRSEIRGQLGRR